MDFVVDINFLWTTWQQLNTCPQHNLMTLIFYEIPIAVHSLTEKTTSIKAASAILSGDQVWDRSYYFIARTFTLC